MGHKLVKIVNILKLILLTRDLERNMIQPNILKILVKNPLTLQPAFPKANAIARPMPLEAPVTTTTGASTIGVDSTLGCAIAVTCAFTPAVSITIKQI